jgi:hypothetical protein
MQAPDGLGQEGVQASRENNPHKSLSQHTGLACELLLDRRMTSKQEGPDGGGKGFARCVRTL